MPLLRRPKERSKGSWLKCKNRRSSLRRKTSWIGTNSSLPELRVLRPGGRRHRPRVAKRRSIFWWARSRGWKRERHWASSNQNPLSNTTMNGNMMRSCLNWKRSDRRENGASRRAIRQNQRSRNFRARWASRRKLRTLSPKHPFEHDGLP